MDWFNYYGLIAVTIVLVPNIISAIVNKALFENKYNNKTMLVLEQVGRYGCMAFMVFNVPYTYFNFWFDNAIWVYIAVNGALLMLYVLGWIVFAKRQNTAKALWLSITPTALFLFCGIMLLSVPLIICAVIFGIAHVTISVKNCV